MGRLRVKDAPDGVGRQATVTLTLDDGQVIDLTEELSVKSVKFTIEPDYRNTTTIKFLDVELDIRDED